MRNVRWMIPALILSLIPASTDAQADESKIEISQLPKAVVKAAKKAFPEAKIVGAAKEKDEEGETTYEVMMKLDGKSIDLAIDEDGEIEEVEKEIEVEDLPNAVVKAARKAFPKAKIIKVEEVSDEDDKVVYELAFETKGGETTEVVMSPNGKILDTSKDEDDEDEDEDDEKPKAKKKEKSEDKPKAKEKEMDEDDDGKKEKPKKKPGA